MSARNRAVSGTIIVLFAIGITALGYAAYVEGHARVFQRSAHTQLLAEAHRSLPPRLAAREGDLLGEIRIPRIGLSAVVAEGDSTAVLRDAIGHVPDTPAPGSGGNAVLAGHRDTFFRPLRDIRAGDEITVTVAGRDVTYTVDWTAVVLPTAVWVLDQTTERTLTLITCHPFAFVGSAPDRFIVRAHERRTGVEPATPSL